jgi:peptidoglycan/xylan/chitin deacetylase (PgdA/CDA1 family)
MLNIRNITIFYFITLWLLFNTSIFGPLFYWIAVPAYFLIPFTASFFMCANLYLKAICKGPKDRNNIVISFNLAEPDKKWSRLGEILNKQKVPAIFFITGKTVEIVPELVAKLANAGNLIGSHSYAVSNKFGFYSARRLLTDLHNTEELIYQATGKEVFYFRPPFGITNHAVRKAVEVIQYQVIGWSKRIKFLDNSIADIPVTGIQNGSIIRIDFTGDQIPESFEKFLIALKESFNIVSMDELINPEIALK